MIDGFERSFSAFCDAKHSVAVNSGTDALRFALMACGVKPGDVVVTVPHTFIATSEAISQAGATPEFVDIDSSTYNMSIAALRRYLEEQCIKDRAGKILSRKYQRPVTAAVPVHLYGQMVDLDPIVELCEEHGLMLVEDACQAHGARYFSGRLNRWVKAGSIGHAAAFSFYPGKNLGACGEGGAATTNDPEIAAKMRMIRDHGQAAKYYHDIEGYNGRLDSIQAGILQVKLAYLEEWNEQRRKIADGYGKLLKGDLSIVLPYEPSWSKAVYHLYVVRTSDRDGMIAYLKERGIGSGIHYPIPLHLQKAYASLRYRAGDFPIAESTAAQIISLPMFPQLTVEDQTKVAEAVLAYSANLKAGQREHEGVYSGTIS